VTILVFLFLATAFLAYSNGANDNFKGVATLFGSGTTKYKPAILLATIATFLGSICSIFLAGELVKSFSGKGLVPDAIAGSPEFLFAVALGAGATVMLATVLGIPISTTHALTGGLAGTGFAAIGTGVNFGALGRSFVLPLLVSPILSVLLAGVLYLFFRYTRQRLGVTKETCLCIGEQVRVVAIPQNEAVLAMDGGPSSEPVLEVGESCEERYTGRILGINAQTALNVLHYASGGLVSFARGLNDTPKIVALLLAVKGLGLQWGMLIVAVCIAAGGLLNARKVAKTMSLDITPLNHGQGFTANFVTAILVGFASRLGLPVSTTHVSVGSIFGIGVATGQANPAVVTEILLSWVLTLPIAAALGGMIYWLVV